jgi:hypothetical protein
MPEYVASEAITAVRVEVLAKVWLSVVVEHGRHVERRDARQASGQRSAELNPTRPIGRP